jgi:molybdopterin-biosynthesis enzyme MoeA-like protein
MRLMLIVTEGARADMRGALAALLDSLGLSFAREITSPHDTVSLTRSIEEALESGDLVFVTGGLAPGGAARRAAAAALGVALLPNSRAAAPLERRCDGDFPAFDRDVCCAFPADARALCGDRPLPAASAPPTARGSCCSATRRTRASRPRSKACY